MRILCLLIAITLSILSYAVDDFSKLELEVYKAGLDLNTIRSIGKITNNPNMDGVNISLAVVANESINKQGSGFLPYLVFSRFTKGKVEKSRKYFLNPAEEVLFFWIEKIDSFYHLYAIRYPYNLFKTDYAQNYKVSTLGLDSNSPNNGLEAKFSINTPAIWQGYDNESTSKVSFAMTNQAHYGVFLMNVINFDGIGPKLGVGLFHLEDSVGWILAATISGKIRKTHWIAQKEAGDLAGVPLWGPDLLCPSSRLSHNRRDLNINPWTCQPFIYN